MKGESVQSVILESLDLMDFASELDPERRVRVAFPHETAEKGRACDCGLLSRAASCGWLFDLWSAALCGLSSERGSDRVEVDEDGGPEGLERRFARPEVAALAPVVAVDDQSEQPLDQWPGTSQMVTFGGDGEGLQGGLAQVFASADPDRPPSTRCAARS